MQESAGLSDDDISITSTAPSEPQEEYDLECILGQKKVDGEDMYLVKWTGYPLERCTWEPESVFCNPQTLQDWARKQKAVARGEEKAFDVDALERKIKAFEEATIKRRERRRKKRERLGYPTKPASDEDDSTSDLGDFVVPDDEVEYIHSDSDEGPLIRRRGETSKTASRDKTSVSSSSTYPQASTKASSKSTSKRPEQQSTLGSSTNKTKPRVPLPHGNRDRPVQPKLGVDTTATAPKPRPAPDPIPILFGGQKARKSLPGPSSKKNGELFNKLSTQRRWEKALRRERAPDISQLELRRPQDWIHPQKDPSPPPPSSEMRDSRYAYDLFVRNEQSPPSVSRQLTSRERVRDLPERRPSWDQPSLEASPSRNASISSYSPLEKERPQYYVSGRTTTRSGRFWNPGEVLLSVNFGAVGKLIGDVRICGLNDATRKQVLKLKRGPNLELNFKDVCTIEEYTLLCERVSVFSTPRCIADYHILWLCLYHWLTLV